MALLKRILITNDDGIDAPGLAVAAEVAAELAQEVWVSAPATDCSGMSRQVSLHAPLRIIRHDERRISVTGSPADSVVVGLRHLLRDTPPDLVLSGINAGTNHASEVGFSGTVGAALTARLLGVPAIAMSQAWVERGVLQWATSKAWLPTAITQLLNHGPLPDTAIYNINVPNAAADEIQGIEITRLGTQLRLDIDLDHRVDHREREYFWLKFGREPQPDARDTDTDALRRNVISIAPIAQDQTDRELYADMAANFVAK